LKLSEAIRLGTMALPWSGDFSACAIGCGVYAIGKNWHHDPSLEKDPVDFVAIKEWPFLRSIVTNPLDGQKVTLINAVGRLNGFYVPRWDRNRIADWVATIEPQDVTNEAINDYSLSRLLETSHAG